MAHKVRNIEEPVIIGDVNVKSAWKSFTILQQQHLTIAVPLLEFSI